MRGCLTCCQRIAQSSELKPKVNITLKTHPSDPLLSHGTHFQEFYNFSKHHHQLGPSFHAHEPGRQLERQIDGCGSMDYTFRLEHDGRLPMHLLGCRMGKFEKRATKTNKQKKINNKDTFQVIPSWDRSTFIK